MRKILFLQNEQHLDRALQDVGGLIALEQQQIGRDKQVDLLAVILLPAAAMEQLASEQQTCDLRFACSATPFGCESVSVNGVWLLLTLSQPDLLHHVSCQESLSRVLRVLRNKQYVQSVSNIFPVFSPEDDDQSIADQVACLQNEHPGLPFSLSLSTYRRAVS